MVDWPLNGLSLPAVTLSFATGLSGIIDVFDKLADKGREAGSSTNWTPLDK